VDDADESKHERNTRRDAEKLEGKQTRRHGWRLMKETVGAHPRLMVLGIIAGLVWATARVSVPLLAGAAIDHGIARNRTGTTLALTAAIVAVGAVQAVGTGLRRYAAFGLAWRVETDIRMRLVAHLQRLHFAFHD
jgi:ABC-type multidrug transport system fused ATPase/permease subunit